MKNRDSDFTFWIFAAILIGALITGVSLALMDFHDPEPASPLVKSDEPIGAQHPKSTSAASTPATASSAP